MESTALSLVVFFLFWTLMLYVQARLSGWTELAKKYKNDNTMVDWKTWQDGRIGMVNIRAWLWISVCADGIYLRSGPPFFFQPFHPTLLIPWGDIEQIEEVAAPLNIGARRGEIKIKNQLMTIKLPMPVISEGTRFIGGEKLLLLEKKPESKI